MVLILLEALGALLLLILIVWWTMFSGRKNGEPIPEELPATADKGRSAEPQDNRGAGPAPTPPRR